MLQHVLTSMNEIITNDYSSSHKAIDIVSQDNKNTDIISLEDGTVETVVSNVKSTDHNSKGLATYGNFIKIKQTNGKTALYAHLKYGSIKVNKGQYINKGTIIGTMGDTGNAYGKHLHLEIKNGDNKENPIISLNEPTKVEENNNNQEKQNNITDKEEIKNNNNQNIIINQETKSKTNQTSTNIQYLENKNYKYGSIVDALKEIKVDSSYNYRKQLAGQNGIKNYHGTYSQNIKLLNLLKTGKLKKI